MCSKGNYSIELAKNVLPERPPEEILFIKDNNKVTTTEAILEGNTYNVTDITAVRMVVRPAKILMPVLFLVFGGMMILNGFATIADGARPLGFVIGVSLGIFGLMLLGDNEPTYSVRISSMSGEIDAISSKDLSTIQSIVDGMNAALMKQLHGST